MAKNEKDEVLNITRGDLDAIIRSAVETATEVAGKTIRGNAGIESTHATEEQRIHAVLGTPIPKRECLKTQIYQCRNPRNGAEFKALVVPSNRWKEGRVVDLIDYRYPDDLEKRSSKQVHPSGRHGGSKSHVVYPLVGGGGLAGPFLPEFLQWVYEFYGKADRNAFVGQSAELLPSVGEPVDWTPEAQARTVGDAGLS
jgi:hypothetical protein